VKEKEIVYLPVKETELVPEPLKVMEYGPLRTRKSGEEMPVRVKLDPASRIKF
jgi:hypothetical protein